MKDTGEYYPFPGALSNFSNDYYLISKTTTYVSTTTFRNRHTGLLYQHRRGIQHPRRFDWRPEDQSVIERVGGTRHD